MVAKDVKVTLVRGEERTESEGTFGLVITGKCSEEDSETMDFNITLAGEITTFGAAAMVVNVLKGMNIDIGTFNYVVENYFSEETEVNP